MTLHIINQSPRQSDSLSECLSVCQDNDSVILIEDAVDAILDGALFSPHENEHIKADQYYVLSEHLKQRSIAPPADGQPRPIDYAEFVALCARHNPIISW